MQDLKGKMSKTLPPQAKTTLKDKMRAKTLANSAAKRGRLLPPID